MIEEKENAGFQVDARNMKAGNEEDVENDGGNFVSVNHKKNKVVIQNFGNEKGY